MSLGMFYKYNPFSADMEKKVTITDNNVHAELIVSSINSY